ncbi:MAG TPA: replication initiator, partial [Mycobacteriales bacterium]
MSVSAVTLTPGVLSAPGVGVVAEACEEEARRLVDEAFGRPAPFTADATALARAARPDYWRWLAHVSGVGGCSAPIRLAGRLDTVDTTTGEVVASRSTESLPDGVVYTACGNRRAAVCPACAEVYRADTYQLVAAGLRGGKGVPDTVASHPCLFLTLTAPSFGLVHTRRTSRSGRVLPCRPRRTAQTCPHGVDLRCPRVHDQDAACLGTPLCLDCYDHDAHVVWNAHASELWRRTTIGVTRAVRRHARRHGGLVRLSFGKVAEYQRRGVVHFHALVRLDGVDPTDPTQVIPPPPWASSLLLAHLVGQAVEHTAFTTPPHPANPAGWPIAWGAQVDMRTVRATGGQITDGAVAGYLAKYATKSTEATGHISQRITADTVDLYANLSTHTGRLVASCWHLGNPASTVKDTLTPNRAQQDSRPTWSRLRRWAHMLGFGGHFFTKSRRYSTTFRALRTARTLWRRQQRTADHLGEETTLVVGTLTYAGTGWRTTG